MEKIFEESEIELKDCKEEKQLIERKLKVLEESAQSALQENEQIQ